MRAAGNAHFEVREWGEDVIFLRASAAGRRQPVVWNPGGAARGPAGRRDRSRASRSCAISRAASSTSRGGRGWRERRAIRVGQLGLFGAGAPQCDPREQEALAALRALDPERTTPLEALAALARLRAQLGRDPA